MSGLGEGARPSGAARADDLGGLRRRTAEADPVSRPLRRFHALPASVSKTCLVRFDNNRYSVGASAVGRPVDIHAYADRIVIRQDGRIMAEHRRSFGRGETVYDPWHYVPVLARKPGALRNGAPFKDSGAAGGVGPRPAQARPVPTTATGRWSKSSPRCCDGLPAVEEACVQALSEGVHSSDVILNILARQRDPGPMATIARRTRCGYGMRRSPIAPDTINSGARDPWSEPKSST